ncbi:multicopper oxidase domain-containing protein [Scytonema sp. PCC 10023]|uniref:multicopper oxidase domain-containing protein n=1 Tax=Scytonema sp. PCC 10023 TaxID=1680591 RepID=UPI0039C63689
MKEENPTASDSSISTLTYHVTALQITIYFNKEGDHDHNGLIFALTENVPILKYIRALARVGLPQGAGDHGGHDDMPEEWYKQAKERAQKIGVSLPSNPQEARQPHPLVRPLVLRARKCDRLQVDLHNEVSGRHVGLHLVGDGYDVKMDDGSHVGENDSSLTPPDGRRIYTWICNHEGVFPFHDGGNYSGGEDGTNVHGLFGALVVEPTGSIWRDPVTGRRSEDERGAFQELDGLYLDILPPGPAQTESIRESHTTLDNHPWPKPCPYPNFNKEAHREFVIIFHDEPEFQPPHGLLERDPCDRGSSGGHGGGGHGEHVDQLPIMPISYRAEPMINRERTLWRLLREGHFLKLPVLNEEQHHSSWMFGDPVTPILKAYIGDPVRIRLVHAGVKETHVFHLHLYEWHAVPQDQNSPRIDAISFSPQTGHTIEPVWGAGNRHQVAGDVIWHCHLYPHFHEGMWGIFRTFETRQDGKDGDFLQSSDPIYRGRRIGRYPDGTPIERLLPLPDRDPPPQPTAIRPGYPLYIPGEIRQKSPTPPWPLRNTAMPTDFDYRLLPTDLERNAFNEQPVPGEMFTRNRVAKQQDEEWAKLPEFQQNDGKVISHDVVVTRKRIEYNDHGWFDPDGHLYYLAAEGDPDGRPGPKEPLFFRAQHGQILNLTLANRLPPRIEGTAFDPPFPPCPERPWEGECSMHVHMVKFDPICGDGASVGWNYISGPRLGRKMVYRWWADQEFGTIFFHDHLFANYRQKHGLFGALIVEPIGAKFYDNFSNREIVSGLQARLKLRESVQTKVARAEGLPDTNWVREFCIAIGDFIPMFDRTGEPLNPPAHPGGHGDQGVMALNYRNEPIRERGGDPAFWFSSRHHPDPATTRFAAFENDPIWFRLVQGSHEEQHSFQIHGMRWRRFRVNVDSPVRNQQTFGIAEAFTFINHEQFGPGDYLYKLSGADDLWLGCWGLIRAFQKSALPSETGDLRRLQDEDTAAEGEETVPVAQTDTVTTGGEASLPVVVEVEAAPETKVPCGASVRSFHVVAEPRRLVYREPDLVDPFGLVYRLVSVTSPDGREHPVPTTGILEPLVLRCREGEWVKVTVENRLPEHLHPEPFAPKVPVEERDPRTFRPERPVSSHVSLHADLLEYDITRDDGANVGLNPEQTIPPGASRTYTWYATRLPRRSNADEPIGPVLLQDMADFRNHRHHGLIGALIVEAEDATPLAVGENEATASENAPEAWYGTRATILRGEEQSEEIVLLLQDGLRLYLNGNVNFPIPDIPADPGEDEPDPEDQGQKGFNYRTEPVGPNDEPRCDCANSRDWLANPNPATPVWCVPVGKTVRFHLVGACDKPRNHSFTIHGVTWPEWRFLSREKQPKVASESAISCATIRTFEFIPEHTGDHAYRSGVLKWAVSQGLWGILRVVGDTDISG